jgi:hypothetical protein
MFLVVGLIAEGSPCVAKRIPEVHGTSLSNQAVNLPEALRGKVDVLVLGSRFQPGLEGRCGELGTAVGHGLSSISDGGYYEMPVLASAPGMVRGFIVRSMRSSVPDQMQARFVPIMDNEAAWRTLVHYGPPFDPYLLVVDGQGDVVWQTHGQPTDGAYAALKQQVETLKTRGLK